jgi:hypothetical protein
LNRHISRAVTLIAAGMSLCISGVQADTAIAVDVNGQALQFQGASPQEFNNSVFVPLRGVFEALGATVNYDSSTSTITASNPTTNIVLQIGSTIASVNGQTQMLSQAARVVNGNTLVPLRFVAQALGAKVSWDESTNTVQIFTSEPKLTALPVPVTPTASKISAASAVSGTLRTNGVNGSPPQITVVTKQGEQVIPILPQTEVMVVELGTTRRGKTNVAQLKPGSFVEIRLDPTGSAKIIMLMFRQVLGSVVSTGRLENRDRQITLDNGPAIELSQEAAIVQGRMPLRFETIQPGQKVVIRINPQTHLGYYVAVSK